MEMEFEMAETEEQTRASKEKLKAELRAKRKAVSD